MSNVVPDIVVISVAEIDGVWSVIVRIDGETVVALSHAHSVGLMMPAMHERMTIQVSGDETGITEVRKFQ